MNLPLVFLLVFNLFLAPPNPREEENLRINRIENRFMTFAINPSGYINLDNKLSGSNFNLISEVFAIVIEKGGKNVTLESREFKCETIQKPSPDRIVIRYAGQNFWKGLEVRVEYFLPESAWYVRKKIQVKNFGKDSFHIKDMVTDRIVWSSSESLPEQKNPLFLENQIFWGMEWPIAEPEIDSKGFVFKHYPDFVLKSGASWISKIMGFGVSKHGRIQEAFGRYILRIRANRVDFTTLYFDWLCHDNSGPLESEILANFLVLKKMKELYGLQFDIYNSDAGLVESMGTYFSQYKTIFDQRFPHGLQTIAEASADLGMKLGLWIGPDGFGESPEEMEARKQQLISWVRDSNVGLFKLDTVVSPIRHENKYILEKKYQTLADALSEIRAIRPDFIAINHRVNDSPYMLTLTDCILWKGEETYIDVHITNRDAWLFNRVCSVRRDLSTTFYEVPFRLFEDHGICFNSSVERWADDFVIQAFGRASVISPEMYGTFFFLRDDDYPRLARLIQLHKQSHEILKTSFLLEDGDIAHSSEVSVLLVLRNMTWDKIEKSVFLDNRIGLSIQKGTPLVLRQRYPFERHLSKNGENFTAGETVRMTLEPFEVKLIQADSQQIKVPYIQGISYEIIPRPDEKNFDVLLLGEPGHTYDLNLKNFGGKTITGETGEDIHLRDDEKLRMKFPGDRVDRDYFRSLGAFREIDSLLESGAYLGEFARFSLNDDALEIREMLELKKIPSRFREVEDCRQYMWEKLIQAHVFNRNAFDGNSDTRWSDGYAKRSPFTGTPQPYRSESSQWRIDMGESKNLGRLELDLVRRMEDAAIETIELSNDLKNWIKIEVNDFPDMSRFPFYEELRRRSGNLRIHDVAAGDGKPVKLKVEFPENRSRYIRIQGRNFSVSEIRGFDASGSEFDRSNWHATNFLGAQAVPSRVLYAVHTINRFWSGQELAVAVHAGEAKLDPVDDVYVVARVGDQITAAPKRAPGYPYHNYEWNSAWIKRNGLDGITFRFPVSPEWKGKEVEIYVLMFGERVSGAKADLYLVTPKKPLLQRILHVRCRD
ncbi:MAG: hypothetical protein V3V52_06335 [Candidatus Adiutricales bacterium]